MTSFSQISILSEIRNYETEAFPANLSFVENKGQVRCFDTSAFSPKTLLFYSSQIAYDDFILNDRISFVGTIPIDQDTSTTSYYQVNRIDMKFIRSNTNQIIPINPITNVPPDLTYRNFYQGSLAFEQVRQYNELFIRELYDGVDLSLTHNSWGMEMFFRFQPGGDDPNDLNVDFEGINNINISQTGVSLGSNGFQINIGKVTAYQFDLSGQVEFVPVQFTIKPSGFYGVVVGNYDTTRVLYINLKHNSGIPPKASDTNLKWATYLGTSGETSLKCMKSINSGGSIGIKGSLYAGNSNDAEFLGSWGNNGAVYPFSGGRDAFFAKLNAGQGVDYYTFIGGNLGVGSCEADEWITGIEVDPILEDVFVTGLTKSTDFPINNTNGFNGDSQNQTNPSGDCSKTADLFYARFNSDGTLFYSTFYGSTGFDYGTDILFHSNGIHIVGHTEGNTVTHSQNGAYNNSTGEGLLLNFDFNNNLYWATRMPVDNIHAICKDAVNNIYVAGETKNTYSGFPVVQEDPSYIGYQQYSSATFSNGSNKSDGFITRFNTQNAITHSSFYGSKTNEIVYDLFSNGNLICGVGIVADDYNIDLTISSDLLPSIANTADPDYSNIIADFQIKDWYGSTSSIASDLFFFAFDSPNVGTRIDFKLAGYLGGSGEEDNQLGGSKSNSNPLTYVPAIVSLPGGEIVICGSSLLQSTPDPNWIIEMPDCNPKGFLDLKTIYNTFNIDMFMIVLAPNGKNIYSTYFGSGNDLEFCSSIDYNPLIDRLYFAGNTQTKNTPSMSWEESLITIDFNDMSTNDIWVEYNTNFSCSGYAGFFELSGLYDVDDPCTNSISENYSEKEITVFPNPFTNEITIGVANNETVECSLMDLNGKEIAYSEFTGEHRFQIENLGPGIYLLVIESNNFLITHKIIKQ